MASLNKVMIIGNLGRDPEIRTTPSGAKVANFSVATNESYTDRNGQRVDRTEWHRMVLWRGLADIAEKYLRKGSTAYFEGKLSTRSWEDTAGQKRYSTEIVVDSMQMMGSRPGSAGGGEGGGGSFGNEGRFEPPANSNANQGQPRYEEQQFSGSGAASSPADDEDLPF